jgi:hypothetical protein
LKKVGSNKKTVPGVTNNDNTNHSRAKRA